MLYIWLGIIVLAIIAEAATAALVSIWFIPSAIVSLVLAMFHVDYWIQIATFIVLSAILVLCSRYIFKKTLSTKDHRTNADAVIGQKAVVTERICNIEETGAVKVMGKEWTARSAENKTFELGDIVTVLEISGVKLICK